MTTTAPTMLFKTRSVASIHKRLINPRPRWMWMWIPPWHITDWHMPDVPIWEYTIDIFPIGISNRLRVGTTIHIVHADKNGEMLTAKVVDRTWHAVRLRTQQTTELWEESDFINANYRHYGNLD